MKTTETSRTSTAGIYHDRRTRVKVHGFGASKVGRDVILDHYIDIRPRGGSPSLLGSGEAYARIANFSGDLYVTNYATRKPLRMLYETTHYESAQIMLEYG
jgi:hypothetical protein